MYESLLLLGEELGFLETVTQNLGWTELAGIGCVIAGALIFGWAFRRFALARLEAAAAKTENDVDDRLIKFVRRFYKGLLAFFVIVTTLRILEVEITPLLAGAGIVGIGVAYAAKDIIGNFLAGLVLLVDRPIKVGDRIQIDRIGSQWGSWGDVVDVGLRTTTVSNSDGVHVTYPNAKFSESVIKNFTPTEAPVRFRVRVLVDPYIDLEAALERLLEIAGRDTDVLAEPKPSAVVRSMFDEAGRYSQGVLLELRCFARDIRLRTRIRSRLLIAIAKEFPEADLRLARPVFQVESIAGSKLSLT